MPPPHSELSHSSSNSALFVAGGLFLDPTTTVSNSLLNSVSFRKTTSSNAVVPGGLGHHPIRLAFSSVGLRSDDVAVRESKEGREGVCVAENGDEAFVGEGKREKVVVVRRGRAMNTTKHLWAGAIAAMVSRFCGLCFCCGEFDSLHL